MTTMLATPPGHYVATTDIARLRGGDQVVALDGHPLPAPREVARGYARDDGARRLVNPNEDASGVQWWLYPRQADEVTVWRVKPAAVIVEQPILDSTLAQLARAIPRIPRTRVGTPIGDDVAVGDVVLVPDEYWRAGVVTRVTPTRVLVRSTTAYTLRHDPHNPYYREIYYRRTEGTLVCRAPAGGWTTDARENGSAW